MNVQNVLRIIIAQEINIVLDTHVYNKFIMITMIIQLKIGIRRILPGKIITMIQTINMVKLTIILQLPRATSVNMTPNMTLVSGKIITMIQTINMVKLTIILQLPRAMSVNMTTYLTLVSMIRIFNILQIGKQLHLILFHKLFYV